LSENLSVQCVSWYFNRQGTTIKKKKKINGETKLVSFLNGQKAGMRAINHHKKAHVGGPRHKQRHHMRSPRSRRNTHTAPTQGTPGPGRHTLSQKNCGKRKKKVPAQRKKVLLPELHFSTGQDAHRRRQSEELEEPQNNSVVSDIWGNQSSQLSSKTEANSEEWKTHL